MEHEKEIAKLINVLRQIRHAGHFAAHRGEDAEVSKFCLQQYNSIVTRISELEPSVQNLFTPLPENTSVKTTHFAVSELIAYLTDSEAEEPTRQARENRHEHRHGHWREHRGKWRCGAKRWMFRFSPSVERF